MRSLILGAAIALVACQNVEEPIANGSATLQTPRWNDVRIDRVARELLRKGSRIAVDRAPVPVLVPRALASKATVMAEEHWAAVHIGHDATTITVHATDVAFLAPELPPAQPTDTVRGAPAWITENEGIRSAAWTEHGIAYTLEIECARPDDARCADDTLLRSLANDLVVVGGKGVTP